METIKIAIAGVGNCASALLQGIEYYRNTKDQECLGLMHIDLGGYRPEQIQPVAAFDVDSRKVGKSLHKAAFALPNCTQTIWPELPDYGVKVQMGPTLDGISPHMMQYSAENSFRVSDRTPCDVVNVLKENGVEILLNYLPVGSERATQFYAQCCLDAGVSLINCIPAFIASNPMWAKKFERQGIPIVGDDIKSQVGATIVHRTLTRLFNERGVKLERTYQLNTGGNTDFLNMLNQERLKSKRISKTEAVQSELDTPLAEENIHIGPSDYVSWQDDNKVCFLRMEGKGFGGVPLNLELRLSVEDSANSGGVAIDAIRYCQIARLRGDAGVLLPNSAYTMKHPPQQMADSEARKLIEAYIAEENKRKAQRRKPSRRSKETKPSILNV